MGATTILIWCLAWILGLLTTMIPWNGWGLLLLGVGMALLGRRFWRTGPKRWVWLMAGAIALLASFYYQFRLPQPGSSDISRLLLDSEQPIAVRVEGTVDSLPHLTRSQKSQFWLEAQQVKTVSGEKSSVSGRVYVTVPPKEAERLHPGLQVMIYGSLYQPKPAANPGAFDFAKYLQREGCFAGMKGKEIRIPDQPQGWGLWQIQQRIVQSQARWLGSPEGPLVSAMVLGGRVVDLPYEVKDAFTRVGLAAALAASGFQTSLILGAVLALTRPFSRWVQFSVGMAGLGIFLGLAGGQPSVLRATIMGVAVLLGLVADRSIKPLGSLLLSAILLLVYNPLWIFDLGFLFSFLATMGLLITASPIAQRLDWLPTAIADLLAVPIAAYVWTLPLSLFAFGVVSPYSIPAMVLTTPLVTVISLGGMVSALAAVIWDPAGSAIAWLLLYPTRLLIWLVTGLNQLPGNAYATGTIHPLILILLYGLIGVTWLTAWGRRRWWVALGLGIILTLVPLGQTRLTLFRVTVLATSPEPVMVVQDRGSVVLINSGDAQTVNFTLLPFFQKAGVNQIQHAIATTAPNAPRTGWKTLQQHLSVQRFYLPQPIPAADGQAIARLVPGQSVQLGSAKMTMIADLPLAATLYLKNQTWLWLNNLNADQQTQLLQTATLPDVDVLWWSGKYLKPELLRQVNAEVAIAFGKQVHPEAIAALQQRKTRLYSTGQDGAIQWTPEAGFTTTLDPGENMASAL